MSNQSIFDTPRFEGLKKAWDARQKALKLRKSYYTGDIYKPLRDIPLLGPKIYKGVKPLYLPLSRAVDVDAGMIPAGWAFADTVNERVVAARDALFASSKWGTKGVLYVHFGAQYGISGLKISDLREQGKIVLSAIDPLKFMLYFNALYDDTPSLAITVEEQEGLDGPYEYAEVITPDEILTFMDGEPFGFDGREPIYPNELGLVPFVEVKHIDTGEPFGEATYQKAIPLLDEVNQLASYLANIIKAHAEAQWAVIGAEPSDLVKSGDNVWFIPSGGDVKAIVASIDIGGVLEFIKEIAGEVKGSLPELSFDELRSKTQIATATLELQLMELVIKINRSRPNYDDGLEQAYRIAGIAAQQMSITEIAPLASEDIDIDGEREIIPLDPQTRISLELQELALERERAAMGILEGLPDESP